MSDPSAALVRLVASIFREAVEDVRDIVQYILGMHRRPLPRLTLGDYSLPLMIRRHHEEYALYDLKLMILGRVQRTQRKPWGYLQ